MSESQKLHHCPICQSPKIQLGLKTYYWRENLLDFYDCQNCGATFANPLLSASLITAGNDALVKHYQQGKSLESEFRDARQAFLRGKILGKRLQAWKKRGRVLELGCYQGFFSYGIKNNSQWEVEGLEIAPELAHFVQNTLGIPCHKGTLEELQLPANQYDFIVCHDLIEHINAPKDFLQQLTRILKPGGRIQILTPNTRQDFAFNRRAYAAGTPITMLLNHIMNFSPKSLHIALESAGLRVNKIYCFGIRHALKDFGLLGLGQPGKIPPGPSLLETAKLPQSSLLSTWTPALLDSLKKHPKTSYRYGIIKEIIPATFRLRLPARWQLGHEIYALAEKPQS